MSSELVYKRMFDQACEERALLVKSMKAKDKELIAAMKENSLLRGRLRADMRADKS